MSAEEKQNSIFDSPIDDLSSLFESEKEETNEIVEETSIFDPKKYCKERR